MRHESSIYERGMGPGGAVVGTFLALAFGASWGYLDAIGMRKTEDVQELRVNSRLEQYDSGRGQISWSNELPYARPLGSSRAIGPTPCSYKQFD